MSSSLQPHGLCSPLQAPLSIEFSRQEYWRRLPFSSPGNLLDPGIEPAIFCIGRQIPYRSATRKAHVKFRGSLFLKVPHRLTYLIIS